MSSRTTLVTGIWDLDRENMSDGWSRSFDHYIENFKKLLVACGDINMIIFIDPDNEDIVWENRSRDNTVVYHHSKEQFASDFFPFFDAVQVIRHSPHWLEQAGWLPESAQGALEYYNPMVMSKMFLLHNAKIFNPFDSDFLYWIDGAITNTIHPGYFYHDKVIDNLENCINKFLFICFPYEAEGEIHGYEIEAMKDIAKSDTIDRVARGGFFGGHKDFISQANDLYYQLLSDSFGNNHMGTEESIFTIMTYLDPNIYNYTEIKDDGLLYTFFENLKNNTLELNAKVKISGTNNDILLYINTFNSPDQVQMVMDSFEKYDNNFITKTKKILINNSTDSKHDEAYADIISRYNMSEVKQGNMGVCGGRQYAAENFKDLDARFMFFFEDDMLLDLSRNNCDFGLSKYVNNIFDNLVYLMTVQDYDFIKLSFSEFYGHNGEQWSWHNVPENLHKEYFNNSKNRPLTKFNNIKTFNGMPYVDGEIYYSNWPHIIDQEGNRKCFLDTTWDYPYEQTWMSYIYTLTKQKKIKPAILLASPITHDRVHFYDGSERKES